MSSMKEWKHSSTASMCLRTQAERVGQSASRVDRASRSAPEKVAVFAFFHLLDSDDVHVRLLGLKALEEGLGEDEVVAAPAGGVAGRQRFASDDPLYIE